MPSWRFGRWGQDKQQHLLMGVAIGLGVGILCDPPMGLAAGIAAGLGKEIVWDWLLGRGTPEILDAGCTMFGAYLAFLLLLQ